MKMVHSAQALGLEIRRARKMRGLSRKEVAERSGIAVATLANLEAGRGTVSPLISVLREIRYRFRTQPQGTPLGIWLRDRRSGLRLSQDRLKRTAGLSKPTIIQIER